MVEIDPQNRIYFPKLNLEESIRLGESSRTMDPLIISGDHGTLSKRGTGPATSQPTAAAQSYQASSRQPAARGRPGAVFVAAKEKIDTFLASQDVTLSMLFSVIDTNSDNQLSKSEFKQKLRALHMGLEEEELECLFKHLDTNGDGVVSYSEFI